MKRSIRMMFAITGVVVLGACENGPTEPVTSERVADPVAATDDLDASPMPVTRTTEKWVTDVTGDHWRIFCPNDVQDSELIRMEGELVQRLTLLEDGAGGFHVQYHSRPRGLRGIGEESGEEFRAVEREHYIYNETQMGSTETWREARRLSGTESDREFRAVLSARFTVNANGELVVHDFDATYECTI